MATKRTLKESSLLIGKSLINGEWTESHSGARFNVYGSSHGDGIIEDQKHALTSSLHSSDPATGEFIGSCPESTEQDALDAIGAAAAAMPKWRNYSGRERGRIMRRWYELVLENREDLAALISWENGKAKPDAMGEVVFAASFLEWFSEEAARAYGDVIPHSTSGFRVSVVKEPVGVCGLITPYVHSFNRVTVQSLKADLSIPHKVEFPRSDGDTQARPGSRGGLRCGCKDSWRDAVYGKCVRLPR